MANSVGNISSEEKKTKLKNALKQILKALTTTVKKIDDKMNIDVKALRDVERQLEEIKDRYL